MDQYCQAAQNLLQLTSKAKLYLLPIVLLCKKSITDDCLLPSVFYEFDPHAYKLENYRLYNAIIVYRTGIAVEIVKNRRRTYSSFVYTVTSMYLVSLKNMQIKFGIFVNNDDIVGKMEMF